ncbi:hypothetical protein [Gilliamella apicola]|uniref:hypothetical protein n=1 Tax=Gilliamella apicola TaxID=1196095 RepID=UPI00080F4D7F|nr:hypothetical protein [Gilliamella apis]OCF95268.1 hypothetical protein A9G16_01175 [Gilliamella apis]
MNKLLINIILAGFLLSGCGFRTESGQTSLENETYQTIKTKIKEGKTTQNQIKQMFGEPKAFYFNGDNEVWEYSFYVDKTNMTMAVIPIINLIYNQNNGDSKIKQLFIFFNKNSSKTVHRYTFSDSSTQIKHKTGIGQ